MIILIYCICLLTITYLFNYWILMILEIEIIVKAQYLYIILCSGSSWCGHKIFEILKDFSCVIFKRIKQTKWFEIHYHNSLIILFVEYLSLNLNVTYIRDCYIACAIEWNTPYFAADSKFPCLLICFKIKFTSTIFSRKDCITL